MEKLISILRTNQNVIAELWRIIHLEEIEAPPSPPLICLEDEDVDMETWNMLMETQDEMVSNSQSVIQISLGTRHRHGLISCYRHTEITEITTTWRIKVVTQGRDQKESKRYPDCIL